MAINKFGLVIGMFFFLSNGRKRSSEIALKLEGKTQASFNTALNNGTN